MSIEDILIAGFAYYSRHRSVAGGQRELWEFRAIDHGEKVGFARRSLSLCLSFRSCLARFFSTVFLLPPRRSLSQKLDCHLRSPARFPDLSKIDANIRER